MSKFVFAAAFAALPVAAFALDPIVNVTEAYARSTNPQVTAAFFKINNGTPNDCVLSSVTAEGYGVAELHTHREEAGVMKMVKVDSITVPAGGTHELARGGDHIMFMKPAAKIEQGQTVNAVLDFGACGTVPLDVTIDNNAGPAPGHDKAEHKHSH